MSDKIKLTKHQNDLIWCLQNGFALVTCQTNGVLVCSNTHEFWTQWRVLMKLVDYGLVHQGHERENFEYVLTIDGENFKTKPCSIP